MNSVIQKSAEYVSDLLQRKLTPRHTFHNLQHTRETVDHAHEIGSNSGLDPDQIEILLIAAWFHDSGHTETYQEHEQVSLRLAQDFLDQLGYPALKTRQVLKLIAATRLGAVPHSLSEKVICDADILPIALPDSLNRGQHLRREWATLLNRYFSEMEWLQFELEFRLGREFYTAYARKRYNQGRLENIGLIRQEIAELEK